jgi:predicted dienelactone hydrolase
MRKASVSGNLFVLAMACVQLSITGFCAQQKNVGFERLELANGPEQPLIGGIWYPTNEHASERSLGPYKQKVAPDAAVAGYELPLVVISHGGGGSYQSHYDTALALAHAGFIVAAISHAGDTYDDQSRPLQLWRRSTQLHSLVSYMLQKWPERNRIDPRRIGAFGFSNGAFTVLVAIGGIPDLDTTAPYCAAHPGHDLCRALKMAGVDPHLGRNVPEGAWTPDPRIKAAIVAAPAFGFTFAPTGLKNADIPVQLWRPADDRHQPSPWYDEAVRDSLPKPPEYHVVPNAGHYAFLPPCGPGLSAKIPELCSDRPGFDRAAFHRKFNAEIVRFFSVTSRR